MSAAVGPLLARATRRLTEAGTPAPAAEARTLLAAACETTPARLLMAAPAASQRERFEQWVERRADGVPVQHLTGVAGFRTVDVAVGPGVFVPRPETEVLTGWAVERLLARAAREPERPPRVVELCAGSGAVSLAISTELAGRCALEQWAVELDDDAVVWTRRNLDPVGVEVVHADMATALAELDGTVDLVVANPPYIPLTAWEGVSVEVRTHDPALALWSGQDGLDAMRVLERRAAALLRPGGEVGAEHAEVQAETAPAVFVATGAWCAVRDHPDLTGRPRFVTAVRAEAPDRGPGLAG